MALDGADSGCWCIVGFIDEKTGLMKQFSIVSKEHITDGDIKRDSIVKVAYKKKKYASKILRIGSKYNYTRPFVLLSDLQYCAFISCFF